MIDALVLTEERAAQMGYSGPGPFTLGGKFPGEYLVGQPVAVNFLGFASTDEAQAAFDEAFADTAEEWIPLEWVTVAAGEGLPIRDNHALSEGDPALTEAAVEAASEDAGVTSGKIRTHAQADAVAAELGLVLTADTVDGKVAEIEAFRIGSVGASEGHVAGDPDALTAAPGAEGTVPEPAVPAEELEEPPA